MRTNELEILKIIDCLIKYKHLSLKGECNSFYSHFNIKGQNDKMSIIKRKSVDREVKRLCECKIFVEEDGVYSINPEYAVLEQQSDIERWREFVWKLLESGEYDTYLMVTKCMLSTGEDEKYLDESEIQIYQHTVKESLDTLKADKSVIRDINDALEHNEGLMIEYKGKEYSVIPICYVISQDGTRTYLCSKRKKRLVQMELRHINVKRHFKADIDRNEYMNHIKRCWDIDTQDSVHVKLLYDQKAAEDACLDEKEMVENLLNLHFGKPINHSDNGKLFYEGEIEGINDFKIWIRKYSEYCLVMEPKKLQEEIVTALRDKRERYKNDR